MAKSTIVTAVCSLAALQAVSVSSALKSVQTFVKSETQKDEYIHFMACRGLLQYGEDGNCDILNTLVKGLGKSRRINNLKHWITKHANLEWSTTSGADKSGGYKKLAKDAAAGLPRTVDIEAAIAAPFYNDQDKNPSVYVPEKAQINYFKKLDTELADGHVTFEQLQTLAAESQAHFAKLIAVRSAGVTVQ